MFSGDLFFLFCNNTVVNVDSRHGLGLYAPSVNGLESLERICEDGIDSLFSEDRHRLWKVATMAGTNHWATVCMRASYQL